MHRKCLGLENTIYKEWVSLISSYQLLTNLCISILYMEFTLLSSHLMIKVDRNYITVKRCIQGLSAKNTPFFVCFIVEHPRYTKTT